MLEDTTATPNSTPVTTEAPSLMGGIGGDKPAESADGTAVETPVETAEEKPAVEAPVVPEKYELAAPEGFEINDEIVGEVEPIFKEIGLSNDAANKLMPLVPKVVERVIASQQNAHEALGADWAKQAKADPYLGGTNWAETETHVARAFEIASLNLPAITVKGEDGSDVVVTGKEQVAEFKSLLDETKFGNHPTVLRMFRLFGQAVGEEPNFVRTEVVPTAKLSPEEVLYPRQAKQKEGA